MKKNEKTGLLMDDIPKQINRIGNIIFKKRFSDKTIWNAKYELMMIYYQKRNLPNDQQSTL